MPLEVGVDIASMSLTYSWGLSPASASVSVPGELEVTVGDSATMNIGGMTFHGVISQNPVTTDNGKTTDLQLVDNRVRLMWDNVYCSINNAEVREDNPDTPGIDRQKRFWHILPDDWLLQKKTWTDAPYTATEVLNILLLAPDVTFTWSLVTHAAQEKPVYAIGDGNGSKLGTLFQEISDQQGLVFTLEGENTLRWVRKGEGEILDPPENSTDLRDGDALSNNDTKVTIVGDRNLYQDLPIELEPDWKSVYEPFWSEPAWLAEVASQFSLDDETVSGQAALAARARSVTVREYAAIKGEAYIDRGTWGEVSRMEIPVWTYTQDIVWKAYRVPTDYTVNGIELQHLEIRDGLMAAVEYSLDDGTLSYKDPTEAYPDAKAMVIAKGQPLDLLDPRTNGAITKEQLDSARDKWTAQNKFNLDIKNNCIIFEHAVFVPGTGENALFRFPNREFVEAGDPLYDVAIPNSAVTVEAAQVRVSLVFNAERYSKEYGTGVRKGSRYVSALNYHALMSEGVFVSELTYADGKTTDEKAAEFGAVITAQAPIYRCGGYTRHGSVGTALTSTIDRVTIGLNFSDAITERVEYTKERSGNTFQNERELDRLPKSRELYPGQRANGKDVERLLQIARLSREIKRRSPSNYASAAEIMQRPVGSSRTSISILPVSTTDPKAGGTLVWFPGGEPATEDAPVPTMVFAGVVVADNSTKSAAVATGGTVPVRVKGPFVSGTTVGAVPGEEDCSATPPPPPEEGEEEDEDAEPWRGIGTVLANYGGEETVLAPVQLGGAGGSYFRMLICGDVDGAAYVDVLIKAPPAPVDDDEEGP